MGLDAIDRRAARAEQGHTRIQYSGSGNFALPEGGRLVQKHRDGGAGLAGGNLGWCGLGSGPSSGPGEWGEGSVFEGFAAIGVDLFLLGREKFKFGQRKPNRTPPAPTSTKDCRCSGVRTPDSSNRIAEGREARGAGLGETY
jgi:hypothetical protein